MLEDISNSNSNNNFSLATIAVMTIIMTPLILLSFPSLLYHNAIIALTAVYGQSGGNDSSPVMIHGGGTGSITCPGGSSKQAVISFVLSRNSSNGKVTTSNWNINEIPSGQNPNPGFLNGSFNSVNLNSGKYVITGQKMSEAHFCLPPVSAPITISGPCNQNVPINVQFQSDNPILMTDGSFKGDVTC